MFRFASSNSVQNWDAWTRLSRGGGPWVGFGGGIFRVFRELRQWRQLDEFTIRSSIDYLRDSCPGRGERPRNNLRIWGLSVHLLPPMVLEHGATDRTKSRQHGKGKACLEGLRLLRT